MGCGGIIFAVLTKYFSEGGGSSGLICSSSTAEKKSFHSNLFFGEEALVLRAKSAQLAESSPSDNLKAFLVASKETMMIFGLGLGL
jgi:hypothetical protein